MYPSAPVLFINATACYILMDSPRPVSAVLVLIQDILYKSWNHDYALTTTRRCRPNCVNLMR